MRRLTIKQRAQRATNRINKVVAVKYPLLAEQLSTTVAEQEQRIAQKDADFQYVVPCRVTEKPDFDTDGDEPIELKWRLSCEVDDAGYKVFSQAYYGGTFCSMGVATTRGILEDLEFLKADKDSAISVDFTFRRLAMMRKPRIK